MKFDYKIFLFSFLVDYIEGNTEKNTILRRYSEKFRKLFDESQKKDNGASAGDFFDNLAEVLNESSEPFLSALKLIVHYGQTMDYRTNIGRASYRAAFLDMYYECEIQSKRKPLPYDFEQVKFNLETKFMEALK